MTSRDLHIPPHPFSPGLDPGLREWLHVRRLAREAKEKRRASENVSTSVAVVKYKYKEWWVDRALGRKEEPPVTFEKFKAAYSAANAIGSEPIAHAAIHSKGIKILQYAHEQGFNMAFRFSSNGKSLLHVAVELGDAEKVDYLLASGADPNSCDDRGFTPLHLSVKPFSTPFNSFDICLMLLESGGDLRATDSEGRTCLHLACLLHSREYVELFLTNRADISRVDRHGRLPYDCCVGQESFRKWFDVQCFKRAPAAAYAEVRAKLLARNFVKEVFNIAQPRCDTCKRKLAACQALRISDFRYWAYCHDRFKGEIALPPSA